MELGMEVRPRQRWTQTLRCAIVAAAALATLSMLPHLPHSSFRRAVPAFTLAEAMRSGTEIDLAGDDADAHGCHASAGYVWCETRSLCIRPWEQGLNSSGALTRHCHPVVDVQLAGGDRDEHDCIPSAGYTWCAAMGSCIRPWEQNLTSEVSFKQRCSTAALELTGLRCNCPPSYAIWSCSEEEYASIMNGTACAYYRHAAANLTETHTCASCSEATFSLACRACENHVSESKFCKLCVEDGLNDVGCTRCSGVGAVEAALAAEEITTELLAAEVVNTTTAGFTTGGLAETRDLQQQQKSSGNRCCGQAPGGVPGSCGAPDWCSNPLDAWCSESQDHCEKHCNGVFCPDEAAVEAALAAEEITTELLAAEVVNATAAGFTT